MGVCDPALRSVTGGWGGVGGGGGGGGVGGGGLCWY